MKNLIYITLLILCFSAFSQEEESSNTTEQQTYKLDLSKSVVELRITTQEFDYHSPWQRKSYDTTWQQGVVIGDQLILTKSHSILQHVFIEASKLGEVQRYTAQVLIKDYNTGLALITVQDPEFFSDLQTVELTSYDVNGTNPYFTSWDSRGIFRTYLSEMYKTEVLFHETGAALFHKIFTSADIVKGGEPVFQDGKLIGITQWFNDEDNILSAITSTMIYWMLYNISDGIYEPQPNFLINGSYLKNDQYLRSYLGLSEEDTGILISSIPPISSAYGYLEEGDVILSIDDININDNGLCDIEPFGPLHYMWLIIQHFSGDEIVVEIIRNREKLTVSFQLLPNDSDYYLIDPLYTDEAPKYLISGGLIFQELTTGYIKRSGNDWRKTENRRFIYFYDNLEYYAETPENSIVILNRVLPLSVNHGYEYARNEVLLNVNEIEVQNIEHVKEIIENSEDKYIVFDFLGGNRIVIEKDKIGESNSLVEENYKIETFDNL